MHNFDVVIVGGAMVGQAFALSMADEDFSMAIVEPNEPNPNLDSKFHTRVSAITPKSQDFLTRIGAWDQIKRKSAFTQTKVWDQNSHGNLSFDAKDDDLPYLGHIIENDAIQSALFNALKKTQVRFLNAKLESIDQIDEGYQIHLDDKTSLSTKLLIGADGARSRIRDLAGIEYSENDYGQKAIVCNIASEKTFNQTTWQRFLSDSIIALLPLEDKQASIVWSAENHLADQLINLDKKTFAKRLSEGVEYRFGLFKVLSDIQSFPLIERSAKDYVKANLALIGDAAHNIHPLAGQGVNLGFADCDELSSQIKQHKNKPLGDYLVLRKYARARRLDNELMAKTMTGLNWIYKENSEPMRWLRGFGMNVIDEVPALKSFFQDRAIGKSLTE